MFVSILVYLSFPSSSHFPLKSLRRQSAFCWSKRNVLVCFFSNLQTCNLFSYGTNAARSCPSSLLSSLALSEPSGRFWARLVRGSAGCKARCSSQSARSAELFCRREVSWLFQLRAVLISSSFFSYQKSLTAGDRSKQVSSLPLLFFPFLCPCLYFFPFASPLWTMPLSGEGLLFVILLFWPLLSSLLCSCLSF